MAEPWKLVGSGQNVDFQTLADPLELIEVAESVLRHEVAYMRKWAKSMRFAGSSAVPSAKVQAQRPLLKADVALLLDSYILRLNVLPSLTYQIRGEGARTSIRSGLGSKRDLNVDIDLKAHSHVFAANKGDVLDELSKFGMPPINGRLNVEFAPGIKSVVFNTLVESIVFDASAVHALFTAVNKPTIVRLGTSMDQGFSAIKDQYMQIFDIKGSDKKPPSPEPIFYDTYVTLAGLAVNTSTLDSVSIAQGAELQFKMGRVHLKATNRTFDHKASLEYPEIEIQLQSVRLDLLRFDNLDLRPCGNVAIGAVMRSTSKLDDLDELVRAYQIRSDSLQINIFTETASVVVAILGHLQDTLKTVDLSQEVKKLRNLTYPRLRSEAQGHEVIEDDASGKTARTAALFSAMYSLELTNVCVTWRVETSIPVSPGREPEDLILSFNKIDLATRKDNAARLLIENFQLQMVPSSRLSTERSLNSALLPEVVFNVAYVSTAQDRRLAFQAAGKSLDLRLTSQFILPANDIRRSIALAIQQVRTAAADWDATTAVLEGPQRNILGNKNFASVLIDADFAGAVVYIQGRSIAGPHSATFNVLQGGRSPQHGRYNQFTPENANNSSTTLKAPGIAFKIEYKNTGANEQSLNAEMKIDASSNILYPTVVPLIMEISSSVKNIVGEPEERKQATRASISQPKFLGDERLRSADPSAIFGNSRLNLGLRICRQEFSLSCQPIARVAATAKFDNIYITVNTVQSPEHGRFFTISGAFTKLQASVQHVYSRESTGSFDVDSIVVSLMNSKHVSAANGISAILNISPMKAHINAKQAQDFLLFREIWVPPEIRHSPSAPTSVPASESQAFIGQRYQQIAATGAFPWNATVSIAELNYSVDLGQSLGKSAFVISNFWVSSKKASNWEQNLCLGFDKMAVNATGRMSGLVELQDLKVRTSIQWPTRNKALNQTPLVQASLAFDHLHIKAAFDYQAFLIADITWFEFMMYNVRDRENVGRDRLVGVLDGDKVQVFCTTTSAAQAIALYQATQRLRQEKVAAYETSLRDIEKFLRRKSSVSPIAIRATAKKQKTSEEVAGSPLKLQTDVVVTLKAVNVGAFPTTFYDKQIFKLEALDASARFAVVLAQEKIHSTLGMTLGQLRIALASVTRTAIPKTLSEVSVAEIVASATGSRGGTILKVPKLVATMETWQNPVSTSIDYVFKSSFQGKVDVGWNYSRISYIRGMWTSHARALAQRLGKPLPQSAVQITGGPRPEGEEGTEMTGKGKQEKITAVVTIPQSKYQYTALQPAIIETPQLRDMGEATPPLEWIGLHRDRLPILTHQIVIVTLLEVAKEVDNAYSRILGSS
ncbi:protein CSF1, partial [Lecanoromycetidae sp. Uapishka_2]